MERVATGYAFRDSVAGTDDEVDLSDIERFDSRREQWQHVAIVAVDARNAVQARGDDGMGLDRRRNPARLVKEGVECRVRPDFKEGFEDFLPSTHPGEPVVCDGDFHCATRI